MCVTVGHCITSQTLGADWTSPPSLLFLSDFHEVFFIYLSSHPISLQRYDSVKINIVQSNVETEYFEQPVQAMSNRCQYHCVAFKNLKYLMVPL